MAMASSNSCTVPGRCIRISLLGARGLVRTELSSLPDPFAVLTVDEEQKCVTGTVKKSLNPAWDEHFDIIVRPLSTLTIQIFDNKKSNRRDQGFLGIISMSGTEIFSNIMDGGTNVIFKDLTLSKINLQVHGRLVFALSLSSQSPSIESSRTTLTSQQYNTQDSPRPRAYTTSQSRRSNTRNSPRTDGVECPRVSQPSLTASPLTPLNLTDIGAPSRMDPSSPLRSRSNANASMRRMLDDVASVPLSPGWQRRLRTHYADHNTCTTTRHRALTHGAAATLPHTRPISQDLRTRSTRDDTVAVVSTPSAVASATAQFGTHADINLPPGCEERCMPEDRLYLDEGRTTQQSSVTGTRLEIDPPLSPLRPRRWEMRLTSIGRVCLPIDGEDDASRCRREYGKKAIYFRSQPQMRMMAGKCEIKIRRTWLLEDSFNAIMALDGEDLKRWLVVSFEGEAGLDFGGVSREWFFLLSHGIFNPSYGLFEYSAHDNYTLQINAASGINPDHLTFFKFIGRCVGLAVFHQKFLDAYFVPSFYKMILGKRVSLADLEIVDSDLHRSLVWMLENDITGILDETFSQTEDRFGKLTTVELKSGGENMAVTEGNKKEYVDAVVNYRISERVEAQFNAIVEGLLELIPRELISIFNERELELLIGGVSEIDIDDWMDFTDYRGYEMTDPVIEWFWRCIRSWPAERHSRLLQFVTGTSRVPVNGFKDLYGSDGPRRFTIEKSGNPQGLPQSHTCFNQLDLPSYRDYETLETKLLIAIEETEGFGQD